jgi:hypothetical protein
LAWWLAWRLRAVVLLTLPQRMLQRNITLNWRELTFCVIRVILLSLHCSN